MESPPLLDHFPPPLTTPLSRQKYFPPRKDSIVGLFLLPAKLRFLNAVFPLKGFLKIPDLVRASFKECSDFVSFSSGKGPPFAAPPRTDLNTFFFFLRVALSFCTDLRGFLWSRRRASTMLVQFGPPLRQASFGRPPTSPGQPQIGDLSDVIPPFLLGYCPASLPPLRREPASAWPRQRGHSSPPHQFLFFSLSRATWFQPVFSRRFFSFAMRAIQDPGAVGSFFSFLFPLVCPPQPDQLGDGLHPQDFVDGLFS